MEQFTRTNENYKVLLNKVTAPATLSPGLHRVTRAPTLTTMPDMQLAVDKRSLGRFRNNSVSV